MSRKPKHTPGPWEMHEGLDYIVVMSKDQTTETALARVDTPENGHLIKAAPDMLAALEAIEMHLTTNSRSAGKSMAARLAWAKEGKRIREQGKAAAARARGAP